MKNYVTLQISTLKCSAISLDIEGRTDRFYLQWEAMSPVSTRGILIQVVSVESERKTSVSSEPTWSTSRAKEKLSQTIVVGSD